MTTSRKNMGLAIALAPLVGIILGCNQQPQQPAQSPADVPHEHSAADHEHAAADHEHSEIEAAMAELSPEDRKLAEQQKICPVSGEPLGSMGKPIKVTVEGREVFVCCEGCIDEVKENFDKYAAKLDQQS
jgi:hypothetical protein